MKKLLAATAVGFLTLGLAACSSDDGSGGKKADISKPVSSVDEAWEQLDELNYSFSKVADTEWVETVAPMLVECAADPEKVQIFTGKKGIFSSETHESSKVASDIAKILERSGLETSIEEDTLTGGDSDDLKAAVTNVYASNEENINLALVVDDTGYIDLTAYSKCVPGSVNDAWSAPGRVPVIKEENKDEIGVEEESVPEEGTAVEEDTSEEVSE